MAVVVRMIRGHALVAESRRTRCGRVVRGLVERGEPAAVRCAACQRQLELLERAFERARAYQEGMDALRALRADPRVVHAAELRERRRVPL